MEVFYYNDEHEEVNIQVNGKIQADGLPRVEYRTLQPQTGEIFNVDAPEGAILHIKRWERRIVLLSYIPAESIDSIR